MQSKGQVQPMERRYSLLVLMALLVFIISGGILDDAFSRLGLFLAIGAALALLLNVIDGHHEMR